MANPKIPKGYSGTFSGNTLVMVSRNEYPEKPNKKGGEKMAKETAKPAPKATQTAINTRPSGKDFTASQKYHYHKDEANKAFKNDDIVKSTNHLNAMRRAEQTMREQAEWAKKNKPR